MSPERHRSGSEQPAGAAGHAAGAPVGRTRRIGLTLGLALALAGAPGVAGAAPFADVTYDLGESSVLVTLSVAGLPDASIEIGPEHLSGTQTIRYTSDSASRLLHAPLSLLSFRLTADATLYTPVAGDKLGSAALYLSLANAPVAGSLITNPLTLGVALPGTGTITFKESGRLRLTGHLHCNLLCDEVGLAESVTRPILTATFTQPLPSLAAYYRYDNDDSRVHRVAGETTATFTVDPGGRLPIEVSAVAQIVGREISVTPIPEPGTLLLLGTGLAGLTALGGTSVTGRRRQRRSP